jgi:hypothetical protein
MPSQTVHPSDDQLRRFQLGALSREDAARVEAWVGSCPAAVEAIRDVRADDSLTAAIPAAARLDIPAHPREEEVLRVATIAGSSDIPPISDSVTELLLPRAVGEYPVAGELGSGGMGVVYECRDDRAGRRVAVKVMSVAMAARPEARERFLREGRAAAGLDHEYVVPVFQVGEDGGLPYIVMPLLLGDSLGARLSRGPVPVAELLVVGRQVAEGLAAAHDHGLIHRDVKPSNVWLEAHPDGSFRRARLLDFGLVHIAAEGDTLLPGSDPTQTPADADPRLTRTDQFLGTPAFASPEQARGDAIDARTDLFSLGVVLYQMATGERPFRGDDAPAVLLALETETPAAPHVRNPAVPRRLADLIMRLLAKDPADRPQTAREVGVELALIGDGVRRSRWGRGRRWRVAVAVVLLGLIGLGAAQGKTIVRVITNQGELVIELDDPDIEVKVIQGGAEVTDKTKNRTFVLKAAGGEVEFYDPGSGAKALTKAFTITRGGKAVVRVTKAEVAVPPGPAKPDVGRPSLTPEAKQAIRDLVNAYIEVTVIQPDREQRVLRRASDLLRDDDRVCQLFIWVRPNGYNPLDDPAAVYALRRLPAEVWDAEGRSLQIWWVANENFLKQARQLRWGFTADQFRAMTEMPGLRPVRHLHLYASPLGDDSLALLARFPELENVQVTYATRVTEVGLKHLAALPRLKALDLTGLNLRPEDLAHFRGRPLIALVVEDNPQIDDSAIGHLIIPTLTHLNLRKTKLTADGVRRLAAALPKLTDLVLEGTELTAAQVKQLAADLPNCTIYSDHGTFEPKK